MKQRNLASLLLAGAMTAALLTGPAQAAESPSPQEIAATRLQAEGLMNGDEHGDLHLDKGLTRAELACLISPIVLNPEHVAWERDYYAKLRTTNFSDVPEWAQVAVGVCASMGVVAGYGDGRFGSDDPVSPQMACTIMLRYLERDGWTYVTAWQGGGTGTCPGGDAGGRDHHPWRHGPPAHRLPGLSGVPANPINIRRGRPRHKTVPGAAIFVYKEEFGQNEKTFIVAVLGLCHTPGHPSHRCPCS